MINSKIREKSFTYQWGNVPKKLHMIVPVGFSFLKDWRICKHDAFINPINPNPNLLFSQAKPIPFRYGCIEVKKDHCKKKKETLGTYCNRKDVLRFTKKLSGLNLEVNCQTDIKYSACQ